MGYVPSLALPWEEGALSHLRQCPTQPPRKPYWKLDSSLPCPSPHPFMGATMD